MLVGTKTAECFQQFLKRSEIPDIRIGDDISGAVVAVPDRNSLIVHSYSSLSDKVLEKLRRLFAGIKLN